MAVKTLYNLLDLTVAEVNLVSHVQQGALP